MKFIFNNKIKQLYAILFCLVLLIVTFNIGGYFFGLKYISIFAANEQVNKYQVRSELLMNATNQTGACFAKSAAEVWASGLKKRSAALQYTVMSKELKDEYAKQLEKSFPNWVTGQSSPWIDNYKFANFERYGDNKYVYKICFYTKTSTGAAGDYNAIITVEKKDEFWRITQINIDKGLYVYTGFKT